MPYHIGTVKALDQLRKPENKTEHDDYMPLKRAVEGLASLNSLLAFVQVS
jgi:hypothetical protein